MKYLYYNWSRYVCLVAFMCSIADRQPIIFTELYWFKLFPKVIFRPKLLERIFKYPVKVSVAKLWNFINDFKMLTVKRTDLIQISTHLSLVIEPARLVIFSIVSVWEASLWSIESADLMRLSPIYRSWPPIHPYCWRCALAVQQKICYSDWQQKKAKCSFIVVFYFP